jgi:N-acylneuraminate cytidylyltransferase
VREHPGKMWRLDGHVMVPFMAQKPGEVPTHSRQTAALPEVYVQDSSLEIARTRIAAEGEIAGATVVPFFTEGHEGFSIDYPDELDVARALAASDPALLPPIEA